MIDFSVVQQQPNAFALPAGTPVWQTCIREVAFVDDATTIPAGAAAWHNEAAYQHLLEVMCGLQSPIVGETEVLHQFKVFADELSRVHERWRGLCAQLLADARAVRAAHLIGLGSRSYGSAVRRHLRECPRVALIGTGVLAREILPFLERDDRIIDLWGRRAECSMTAPGLTYRSLGSPGTRLAASAAVVVAAPVPASTIAELAGRYRRASLLIDLRAEGAEDPPPPIAPMVTLADVFAGFEAVAHDNEARVGAAKAAIAQCARDFASRAKLNPFGWHDLCA